VASAVVRSLVDVGYIPDINHDFSQWGLAEGLSRDAFDSLVADCLKESSLLYTILAAGLGDGYSSVKYPFGHISNIRPIVTLLYLIIAAIIFMAAVDRRKPVVFGMVLLAALISTGAILQSLEYYLAWNYENSGCRADEMIERAKGRMAESLVKQKAQELQTELDKTNGVWSVSVRAEGRALIYTYRFKEPIDEGFYRRNSVMQKQLLDWYCSRKYWAERDFKVTESHTLYSSKGERLISFSIGPADCSQ
jgi:hypothetical protein